MNTSFWVKRFLMVSLGAFAILSAVQMLKGDDAVDALIHGAVWGVFSGAVFTVTRFVRARRKQHCALCKDTPEMLEGSRQPR